MCISNCYEMYFIMNRCFIIKGSGVIVTPIIELLLLLIEPAQSNALCKEKQYCFCKVSEKMNLSYLSYQEIIS